MGRGGLPTQEASPLKPKKGKKMLYSTSHELVDNKFTYLETNRVFSGNYWDEFALPGLFKNAPVKVLFLGVGQGGGIQPLFSSCQVKHIDAVDIDPEGIENSKQLFQNHFPKLNINFHCLDAKQFLQNSKTKYDLIFIDLYSFEGPAACIFEKDFSALVVNSLKDEGIIFQNIYGLPMHLSHDGNQDVDYFNNLWSKNLENIYNLPFRRNTSVVASRQPLELCEVSDAGQSLKPMDYLSLQALKARASHIEYNKVKVESLKMARSTPVPHTENDKAMVKGWQKILSDLNLIDHSINLKNPRDILKIFSDSKGLGYWVSEHLKFSTTRGAALLTLLAGEDSIPDSLAKMHLAFVLGFCPIWQQKYPGFYFSYALPQIVSCAQRKEGGHLLRFELYNLLSQIGEL